MKYIILELIPTSLNPTKGEIIQLSALKLNDLNLIDRFDYRIIDSKVPLESMLDMISYDKDKFIYKDSKEEILTDFIKWIEDYKLLIIDNQYTLSYLNDIANEKESIFNYLNMKYHDNIIDDVINKYKLEPSNYIVDLLYEALIYESNNRK
jgi:DNA polymerase III alpha subunit (gram-positive type)